MVKVSFENLESVILSIGDEYKLINGVISVNQGLPSHFQLKEDVTYVVLSEGYITYEGKLKEYDVLS